MRTLPRGPLLAMLLGGLSAGACGKKTPPAPAPSPAPAAAPAPAPEPEPEPVPEPEPELSPAERPHNADFSATITFADGSAAKGHVVRVERTSDWYGDDGWTDRDSDLRVTVEGNGTETDLAWSDIARIDITYGASSSDIDCSYDSSYEPAMYMCINRTTSKVKGKDGKGWEAADRHKWMFVFESGEVVEFYVHKLPARRQEDSVPELGTTAENTALYEALQADLAAARRGRVPKSIAVGAP